MIFTIDVDHTMQTTQIVVDHGENPDESIKGSEYVEYISDAATSLFKYLVDVLRENKVPEGDIRNVLGGEIAGMMHKVSEHAVITGENPDLFSVN